MGGRHGIAGDSREQNEGRQGREWMASRVAACWRRGNLPRKEGGKGVGGAPSLRKEGGLRLPQV